MAATPKFILDDAEYGYERAMLWTSTDSEDDPLDSHYSIGDIASEAKKKIRRDISKFLRANKAAVKDYVDHRKYNSAEGNIWEHLGHDLWLDRNGHGTGFWDRDYGGRDEIGEKLHQAAKKLGSSDAYCGDNGKIYVSP